MWLAGKRLPFKWDEWFNRAEAKPLPGAIEFLHYANSLGVAIYYISNRYESQKDITIRNCTESECTTSRCSSCTITAAW